MSRQGVKNLILLTLKHRYPFRSIEIMYNKVCVIRAPDVSLHHEI
jgi:hypothetical protein